MISIMMKILDIVNKLSPPPSVDVPSLSHGMGIGKKWWTCQTKADFPCQQCLISLHCGRHNKPPFRHQSFFLTANTSCYHFKGLFTNQLPVTETAQVPVNSLLNQPVLWVWSTSKIIPQYDTTQCCSVQYWAHTDCALQVTLHLKRSNQLT
jgi:hypothetical protein